MSKPWVRASSLVIIGAVCALDWAACGTPTACDHAVDKVRACGYPDAKLTQYGEACEAYAACAGDCVMAAPCIQIKASLQGDTSTDLNSCLFVCLTYPHPTDPGACRSADCAQPL